MKDLWLPGPHITEGTRGGREPSGKNYSDRGGFMDKGARERKGYIEVVLRECRRQRHAGRQEEAG